MPSPPLLSICIPTYNRAKLLAECLDHLIPMVQQDTEVEIVVSDNASTDGTREIVERNQSLCPNLKYFRNEANYFFDRNVQLVAMRASGEFLWFVGDDDLVVPGSINKIKRIIQDTPGLALIQVNFQPTDVKTGAHVGPPGLGRPNNLLVDNFNRALALGGYKLAFFACIIARRDFWLNVDVSPYFESGFSQVRSVLAVMPQGRVYLLKDVCLQNRYAGEVTIEHWSKSLWWWRVNFIELEKVFKSSRNLGYSWGAIWVVLLQIRWWLIKSIAFFKMTQHPLLAGSFSLLSGYYEFSPLFWLLIAPLYVMPRTLLKAAYNLRKLFYKGLGA